MHNTQYTLVQNDGLYMNDLPSQGNDQKMDAPSPTLKSTMYQKTMQKTSDRIFHPMNVMHDQYHETDLKNVSGFHGVKAPHQDFYQKDSSERGKQGQFNMNQSKQLTRENQPSCVNFMSFDGSKIRVGNAKVTKRQSGSNQDLDHLEGFGTRTSKMNNTKKSSTQRLSQTRNNYYQHMNTYNKGSKYTKPNSPLQTFFRSDKESKGSLHFGLISMRQIVAQHLQDHISPADLSTTEQYSPSKFQTFERKRKPAQIHMPKSENWVPNQNPLGGTLGRGGALTMEQIDEQLSNPKLRSDSKLKNNPLLLPTLAPVSYKPQGYIVGQLARNMYPTSPKAIHQQTIQHRKNQSVINSGINFTDMHTLPTVGSPKHQHGPVFAARRNTELKYSTNPLNQPKGPDNQSLTREKSASFLSKVGASQSDQTSTGRLKLPINYSHLNLNPIYDHLQPSDTSQNTRFNLYGKYGQKYRKPKDGQKGEQESSMPDVSVSGDVINMTLDEDASIQKILSPIASYNSIGGNHAGGAGTTRHQDMHNPLPMDAQFDIQPKFIRSKIDKKLLNDILSQTVMMSPQGVQQVANEAYAQHLRYLQTMKLQNELQAINSNGSTDDSSNKLNIQIDGKRVNGLNFGFANRENLKLSYNDLDSGLQGASMFGTAGGPYSKIRELHVIESDEPYDDNTANDEIFKGTMIHQADGNEHEPHRNQMLDNSLNTTFINSRAQNYNISNQDLNKFQGDATGFHQNQGAPPTSMLTFFASLTHNGQMSPKYLSRMQDAIARKDSTQMRAIEKIRMHYEFQEEKGQKPNKKVLRALKNDIKLKELEKQLNLAGSHVKFAATNHQFDKFNLLKSKNQDHLESYRNLRDMPSIVSQRNKENQIREQERTKQTSKMKNAAGKRVERNPTQTQLGLQQSQGSLLVKSNSPSPVRKQDSMMSQSALRNHLSSTKLLDAPPKSKEGHEKHKERVPVLGQSPSQPKRREEQAISPILSSSIIKIEGGDKEGRAMTIDKQYPYYKHLSPGGSSKFQQIESIIDDRKRAQIEKHRVGEIERKKREQYQLEQLQMKLRQQRLDADHYWVDQNPSNFGSRKTLSPSFAGLPALEISMFDERLPFLTIDTRNLRNNAQHSKNKGPLIKQARTLLIDDQDEGDDAGLRAQQRRIWNLPAGIKIISSSGEQQAEQPMLNSNDMDQVKKLQERLNQQMKEFKEGQETISFLEAEQNKFQMPKKKTTKIKKGSTSSTQNLDAQNSHKRLQTVQTIDGSLEGAPQQMLLGQKYSSKQLLSQAALIVTGKHISGSREGRDMMLGLNNQPNGLDSDEQSNKKITFAKLANSQSQGILLRDKSIKIDKSVIQSVQQQLDEVPGVSQPGGPSRQRTSRRQQSEHVVTVDLGNNLGSTTQEKVNDTQSYQAEEIEDSNSIENFERTNKNQTDQVSPTLSLRGSEYDYQVKQTKQKGGKSSKNKKLKKRKMLSPNKTKEDLTQRLQNTDLNLGDGILEEDRQWMHETSSIENDDFEYPASNRKRLEPAYEGDELGKTLQEDSQE